LSLRSCAPIILAVMFPSLVAAAEEVAVEVKSAAARDVVSSVQAINKAGTLGAKLLLPLYLIDTNTTNGPTTFFAVRNESDAAVTVTVKYFTADTAYRPGGGAVPQFQAPSLALARKATATVDIRAVVDNLDVDGDGIARGFIVFETEGGADVIHGDYFLIDDQGNFASGYRLVNIDPESTSNDLCGRFSIRFLDSSLFFDAGTVFTVWLQPADPFDGIAFAYSVFGLAGGDSLLDGVFPSSVFAFEVAASSLRGGIVPDEFGAIEFELPLDTVGHVSAVMSALGRFSVGFEATCLDPI